VAWFAALTLPASLPACSFALRAASTFARASARRHWPPRSAASAPSGLPFASPAAWSNSGRASAGLPASKIATAWWYFSSGTQSALCWSFANAGS